MDLSTDDINTILKEYLSGKKFELISCESVQDKGYVAIGFLSVQTKVCVKYKIDDNIEELHLFIKSVPEIKARREAVISTGAFTKEVAIFEKFLKDVKKKLKGNPIPTCYLAKDNDKIVLNDLSYLGFRNFPLFQTFNLEHCERAIESIAKLHSAALTFEARQNCKINEYLPELMKETIFSTDENHVGNKAVRAGLIALREISNKYLPDYPEDLVNRVFNYFSELSKIMGPSLKYPNVFSHCDLWANNIMFSYDEQNIVKECCLVDFQFATVRPLSNDMYMLIYICTDEELRKDHIAHLEKLYYNNLSQNLSRENIDISNILPWEDYINSLNETRPVLLSLAPQFLSFVLMPDYILNELMADDAEWKYYYEENRTPYALKAAAEVPAYRSRVTNALIAVYEYFKVHKEL